MSIPLKKYELHLGAAYFLVEFLVLPQVLTLLNSLLQMQAWLLNFIAFAANFVCLVAIFHKFLWSSLLQYTQRPWKTLLIASLGLMLYYVSSLMVQILIISGFPNYVNLNDSSVTGFVVQGGMLFSLATVLLVPVAEELLFRGVLFRGLYDRSPILAWCVSTLAFSAVHVVGYLGKYSFPMLLIALVQYLPAGLCLNFAYHKSDTIIAPILMHIFINAIALGMIS